MRIDFNEISVKATRRWVDEDGKKRQQTKKFFQTLNPFNRTKDGQIKSKDQITKEIFAERDAWLKGETK